MSTMTPKMVMFTLDVGDTPKLDAEAGAAGENVTRKSIHFISSKIQWSILVHHNKLEELVAELSASLSNVKHEQEFMEVRERIHRASTFILLFYFISKWTFSFFLFS